MKADGPSQKDAQDVRGNRHEGCRRAQDPAMTWEFVDRLRKLRR